MQYRTSRVPTRCLGLIRLPIVAALLAAGMSIAQTAPPAPTARAELIERIRQTAHRHVDANSGMQTGAVLEMYRSNPTGLGPEEVGKIYEDEYTRYQASRKPGPWKQFRANAGWITAGILFLLFILRDVLKEKLSGLLSSLGTILYAQLAASPILRRVVLRKYLARLVQRNKEVHIPFRPNRPLQMEKMYVPTKVSGIADNKLASDAVIKNSRLLVLGRPGSGKSIFLKHLILRCADKNSPYRAIPVFLSLEKMNASEKPLEQLLADEMAIHGFPKAENFLIRNLQGGNILVLLDGLDEVASGRRQAVAKELADFLAKYEACRAVITCRAGIYHGDLADAVQNTVEIEEFRDQDMRRFLLAWQPEMPENRSIEQLMQTLHDRPAVKTLARNPLLLTIVAYLYTDTKYGLPYSRAEFYKQSADVLLQLWHHEQNHYGANDKRAVLRGLALFNQDRATQQQDRLSMDYQTVLAQIRTVLPSLSIPDEQCPEVLREIVERSGLLLSIDGGQRYQFAHLTLQEYFAAEKLIEDSDGLTARFKEDRDRWRETVKLQSGLLADSSVLIETVYLDDQATALECLAEAQSVRPSLADQIIQEFEARMGSPEAGELITRALAAVASQPNPRGLAVFGFLVKTLNEASLQPRREAAAQALSLTNLRDAAKVLAGHYDAPHVPEQLVRMGDVAIPELVSLIRGGTNDAIRDLFFMGTPQAAEAMVPFLWHSNETLQTSAAWFLGASMSEPDVENALRSYRLSANQRSASASSWVWQDRQEPGTSSLPAITNRIAFLLERSKDGGGTQPSTRTLDPRVGVPLVTISAQSEWRRLPKPCPSWLDYLKLRGPCDQNAAAGDFVKDTLRKVNASDHLRAVLTRLPVAMQVDIIHRMGTALTTDRVLSQADWEALHEPSEYDFDRGWHLRAVAFLVILLSLVALSQSIATLTRHPSNMEIVTVATFLIASAWLLRLMLFDADIGENWAGLIVIFSLGPLVGTFVLSGMIADYKKGDLWKKRPKRLEFLFPGIFFGSGLILFLALWLRRIGQWRFSTAACLLLAGVIAILVWLGQRRERTSKNPLRGVMAITEIPAVGEGSLAVQALGSVIRTRPSGQPPAD